MQLFTGLKKIRDFEKLQFPYLKTAIDLDMVIEIGFAAEQRHPLTLKRLYLLNICSRATARRKLNALIERGVVIRQKRSGDLRSSVLTISSASMKLFNKYSGTIAAICVTHFR